MTLQDLLTPVTTDSFFAEHWEKHPLLITRHDLSYYQSLLTGVDIDYLLSAANALKPDSIEILGEVAGKTSADRSAGGIVRAYQQGASIRINGVQRYWKPLWMLCKELQRVFSCRVGSNFYCTPTSSRGLHRHYDTHDVFVLQITGRKNWRIFDAAADLPLQHLPVLSFEALKNSHSPRLEPLAIRKKRVEEKCVAPIRETVLEPGDLLYLPRGYGHEAWTENKMSAHITIGIHVITWLDLLSVALGQAGKKDVLLRQSLPPGFANATYSQEVSQEMAARLDEIIEALRRQVNVQEALEELAGSFIYHTQTIGEGSFTDGFDAGQLTVHTTVERRPGILWRLAQNNESIGLYAYHSSSEPIVMPVFFAETMRFIAQTERFKIADVPGKMSRHSKLALIRRLLAHGYLRVAK